MSDHDFGRLSDLLDRIEQLAYNPETAGAAVELSAAMLSVLATGPTFAAIQSMIAANQGNSLMYYNAVSNQQLSNILGMVATTRCVQQMLDGPH